MENESCGDDLEQEHPLDDAPANRSFHVNSRKKIYSTISC